MAQLISGKARTVKNGQAMVRVAMSSVPALKKLPRSVKIALGNKITCRMVTAGSTIGFKTGQRNSVFFLVKGKAVAVKAQFETTEIISLDDGSSFADPGELQGLVQPTSVVTTTNCLICSMPASVYAKTVSKYNNPIAETLWSFSEILNGLSALVQGTVQRTA